MKIGVVFAGQGAQYSGMGKDLYDNFPKAKEIFDKAGEEVKHYSFEGTHEELRQTQITQPCVYTVTMAAWEVFKEALEKELGNEVEIMGMAGFSLGEYSALTAADSIPSIEEGLDIVRQRGKFMMEAGTDEEGNLKGGMAAAFGKREKILGMVDEIKGDHILEAVNFNSPVQTAIAGERAILPDLVEAGRERRIKVKLLSTGAAFHSSMMDPAAEKLEVLIREKGIQKPEMKVYSNTTAKDMRENDLDMPRILAIQAKSPVYWQETVENMAADGARAIVELGPGKTLTGFTKKTVEGVGAFHVQDKETLEETIAGLKEMKENE